MNCLSLVTLSLVFLSYALPARALPMIDRSGEKVGEVEIRQSATGKVTLSVNLHRGSPGKKAIHIHENGKCDTPKFESAGAHFNPTNKKHGKKNPQGHHLGDLPNINISKDGSSTYRTDLKTVSLTPGEDNTLSTASGTALIIHENMDDEKTDPTGKAGDRIYCAILSQPTASP